MRDLLHEIYESIRRNKLRTCLTGFAVAWGIFMLIVLLGAGNGILNSYSQGSENFVANTIMFGGGYTSMPYNGLKAGRRIDLNEKDVNIISGKLFSGIVDKTSPTISYTANGSLGSHHVRMRLDGQYPIDNEMTRYQLVGGRLINDIDIRLCRKVIFMPSNNAAKFLPDEAEPTDLIGQMVKMDGTMFLVVGITKAERSNDDTYGIVPFTTLRKCFNPGNDIDMITFSFHGLDNEEENEQFEESFRAAINGIHRAAPSDTRTIWIWNRFTQNLQMQNATRILHIALWIIGLFTLLSGVVGVSNIMLISVKERTHEFGIRKAIGARPANIMKLIVSESIIITSFFGYLGMVLGLATCELLDKTLGQKTMDLFGSDVTILLNPTVGLDIALEATLVLILAGTLAGLIPARKASKVRPIEALRSE